MNFMFGVGAAAAVLKLIIGIILLKVMKLRMYQPYNLIKHKVIITMVATLAIMTTNAIINYLQPVNFSVFWAFVVSRNQGGTLLELIFRAIISFFIYVFEIFLLCFTTDSVDYRIYIYNLMIGMSRPDLIQKISIFLKCIPNNELSSLEDENEKEDSNKVSSHMNTTDRDNEMDLLIEDYERKTIGVIHTQEGSKTQLIDSRIKLLSTDSEYTFAHRNRIYGYNRKSLSND